ncbi:hypothetical protein HZA56_06405 [Candidatus Poribacteria bacterium]|nr:hypothetical protein [Candidatus Poribacteria bacterium]
MLQNLKRRIRRKTQRLFGKRTLSARLDGLADRLDILATRVTLMELRETPRFKDELRLSRHGTKIYSRSDEDGIIQEILARIGVVHSTFVEIGVGKGSENNTAALLIRKWKGVWLEGGPRSADPR